MMRPDRTVAARPGIEGPAQPGGLLYGVTVGAGFTASHHVRLPDGAWEAPHVHPWRVRVHFAAAELDSNAMVVDFCAAQKALGSILAPLQDADLNVHPAFSGRSPTAEVVARWVFDQLTDCGVGPVWRVEVTEAPGCAASFGQTP